MDMFTGKILKDTESGAGALALEQLYRQCQPNHLLSRQTYEQIGGVKRAIGQRAKTIYQALDAEAQAALDSVFAELITVDPERGVAIRRRASMAKLCATPAGKQFATPSLTFCTLLRSSNIRQTAYK